MCEYINKRWSFKITKINESEKNNRLQNQEQLYFLQFLQEPVLDQISESV